MEGWGADPIDEPAAGDDTPSMQTRKRAHLDQLRHRIRRARYQVDADAVAVAILDRIAPDLARDERAPMPARHRGTPRV